VDQGYQEITLLGQNVNAYGKDLDEGRDFADLLEEVAKLGIPRLRFTTSHPWDFSSKMIDVIAKYPNIMKFIHLPVQSGNDEVLRKMGRRYTRNDYLNLVKEMREKIPGLSLSTDIIVGFPGETEEDYEETLSLVREVGYDSAFTFIYSKRTGTPAASYPDQVPDEVAHARLSGLLSVVKERAEERCARFTGQIADVLVEETNREKGLVTGRTPHNIVVHLPGDASMIGKIIPVKLTKCLGFYYIGEPVND
jgi:tRNA-2-methylthio-N6-dimethylallyladenosine synthase